MLLSRTHMYTSMYVYMDTSWYNNTLPYITNIHCCTFPCPSCQPLPSPSPQRGRMQTNGIGQRRTNNVYQRAQQHTFYRVWGGKWGVRDIGYDTISIACTCTCTCMNIVRILMYMTKFLTIQQNMNNMYMCKYMFTYMNIESLTSEITYMCMIESLYTDMQIILVNHTCAFQTHED